MARETASMSALEKLSVTRSCAETPAQSAIAAASAAARRYETARSLLSMFLIALSFQGKNGIITHPRAEHSEQARERHPHVRLGGSQPLEAHSGTPHGSAALQQ